MPTDNILIRVLRNEGVLGAAVSFAIAAGVAVAKEVFDEQA